jgi:deazaflavin-dependent oxidoreductase (nitroreductase family)
MEVRMSTDSSAAIRDTRKNWMVTHREDYLRSGGADGHIMDLTAVGGTPIGAHCLVKYVGRKSGRTFITPLCYGIVGAEFVIVASKGGADHHPDWYLNIVARPEVELQVGGQAWRCTWREPDGAERGKVWDHMVDNFPFYANYQASTERTIPLVLMTPVEAIPVFKESDATGVRQL